MIPAWVLPVDYAKYAKVVSGGQPPYNWRVYGDISFPEYSGVGSITVKLNLTYQISRTSSTHAACWHKDNRSSDYEATLWNKSVASRDNKILFTDTCSATSNGGSQCIWMGAIGVAGIGNFSGPWRDVVELVNEPLTISESDYQSGEIPATFTCWASGAGAHGDARLGKGGSGHPGIDEPWGTGYDKENFVTIQYWCGNKSNTDDNDGKERIKWSMWHASNPFFTLSNGTDSWHYKYDPSVGWPKEEPKFGPSDGVSGTTYVFKEWRRSKLGPPGKPTDDTWPWGGTINRDLVFVAVWEGDTITAEYWDGKDCVPGNTNALVILSNGKEARYPYTEPYKKLEKGKSHTQVDPVNYSQPPDPIWLSSWVKPVPPESDPEFLYWERQSPVPIVNENMPGTVPLNVSHVWKAKWKSVIVPPTIDKGKCMVGGGIWRMEGTNWKKFPTDYNKVTTECGVPKVWTSEQTVNNLIGNYDDSGPTPNLQCDCWWADDDESPPYCHCTAATHYNAIFHTPKGTKNILVWDGLSHPCTRQAAWHVIGRRPDETESGFKGYGTYIDGYKFLGWDPYGKWYGFTSDRIYHSHWLVLPVHKASGWKRNQIPYKYEGIWKEIGNRWGGDVGKGPVVSGIETVPHKPSSPPY